MAERLVIGLFQSSGIALDAVHRLVTEGVSSSDIAHRVLKEVGPTPALETDFALMLLDPVLVENARETFASHIRNGETAVFARAVTDEQVEFASDILKLYLPITIEVLPLPEGSGRAGP
jgi:hypothetical protein